MHIHRHSTLCIQHKDHSIDVALHSGVRRLQPFPSPLGASLAMRCRPELLRQVVAKQFRLVLKSSGWMTQETTQALNNARYHITDRIAQLAILPWPRVVPARNQIIRLLYLRHCEKTRVARPSALLPCCLSFLWIQSSGGDPRSSALASMPALPSDLSRISLPFARTALARTRTLRSLLCPPKSTGTESPVYEVCIGWHADLLSLLSQICSMAVKLAFGSCNWCHLAVHLVRCKRSQRASAPVLQQTIAVRFVIQN